MVIGFQHGQVADRPYKPLTTHSYFLAPFRAGIGNGFDLFKKYC